MIYFWDKLRKNTILFHVRYKEMMNALRVLSGKQFRFGKTSDQKHLDTDEEKKC